MQNRLIALICLFALTLLGVQAAARVRLAQLHRPDWNKVPYQFQGWTGQDAYFNPIYGKDAADTSLLRVYRRDAGAPVIVYVGFYGDLAAVLDVHTPEICYPSQGWRTSSAQILQTGSFRGTRVVARQMSASKQQNHRLVVWWYNAGSHAFETRIRYVWAMLAMSSLTGRTDGSMVRLEVPFEGSNEQAAREQIEEFQKGFLPALDRALPR